MWPLFRTVSFRYLSRRWLRAGLIALCVALGVSTIVATQALNVSMAYAAVVAANPTSGMSDLVVSNGDLPVPRNLADALARVPGVAEAHPRIMATAIVPALDNRTVTLLGVDVIRAMEAAKKTSDSPITVASETQTKFAGLFAYSKIPFVGGAPPTLLGRDLFEALPKDLKSLKLRRGQASEKTHEYAVAGAYDATGVAAALGGFVVVLDLADAAHFLGMRDAKKGIDLIHRVDLTVAKGADVAKVKAAVAAALQGQAEVRSFEEQTMTTRNVMAGMQTGFALCGLAALVVGMFLVYNTLSVTVTERRHEIGVLLALGATRTQIARLFAGEALLLGTVGALAGLPLGVGIAKLSLGPMQSIIGAVFAQLDKVDLHVSWKIHLAAASAGILTTLLASLIPALRAARENPAEAVRKVLKASSAQTLALHITAATGLVLVGAAMILLRDFLPARIGALGGMALMMIGGLVASPFFSTLLARLMQPAIRRFASIEWRLGVDNIVRSPGRTGLVIGALSAGVSLVVQTAGVIRSNRVTIREWVDDTLAVDLLVTAGSPVGPGGQTQPIPRSFVQELRSRPDVEAALPVRLRKIPYGKSQVLIMAIESGEAYRVEKSRLSRQGWIESYDTLDRTPDGVLVSENFAAVNRLSVGDVVRIPSPAGEVQFTILAAVPDFSWNHGTLFVHRRDFVRHWKDDESDVVDLYLKAGTDAEAVKRDLLNRFASKGLFVMTRTDVNAHIDSLVEGVYGVAYAQQIVVMIVAALGVVTALLIAVLQRRHEMGLLRAVGASRTQVIGTVLAEACLMGVIGSVIGALVGLPLEWFVLKVVIFEEAGFVIPVHLPWREAALVIAGALTAATLAGLGPALYAVRERIPDTISYE